MAFFGSQPVSRLKKGSGALRSADPFTVGQHCELALESNPAVREVGWPPHSASGRESRAGPQQGSGPLTELAGKRLESCSGHHGKEKEGLVTANLFMQQLFMQLVLCIRK